MADSPAGVDDGSDHEAAAAPGADSGFGIDRVAAAAGNNPDILRLENLDTDLAPPPEAVAATRAAAGRDEANSYLPFTGRLTSSGRSAPASPDAAASAC